MTAADIAARDELIADQESLLNTYRCLYGVDAHAVPGGCDGTVPSQGRTQPGTFEGAPTAADISVRDQLIANQEELLNAYRCQFNVDIQLVPGGCRIAEAEPQAGHSFTAISAGRNHTVRAYPTRRGRLLGQQRVRRVGPARRSVHRHQCR